MPLKTPTRFTLGKLLAEKAGRIALDYFHAPDLRTDSKGPGDVVTEADFAVEHMLRAAILEAFPDDAIIGEELGGKAATDGYTWLVDPIDGTVNFARRLSYFCVSLALLKDNRPIAAWVFDPVTDELFWADTEHGARLGDTPIACARNDTMVDAVIGLGFSGRHEPKLYREYIAALSLHDVEFRRLGAGALCLAHVAAGRLDAYVEPHMNPWDAVGGLFIAAMAGAVTKDYLGANGLEHGAPVFAASPATAERLLAILPAMESGTPQHRQNDMRSAGKAAT
ncbi:inositol monophosphatase family protein [uncultured Nitratireductor sp.]|uniref:inositol monophosphatase family protein n=1 Tax=uncultured Nitratireductor sp. TaxID=520953 RepID=UPI0025CC1B08|nr:inositol monophosphatase family protein [uncultured Nitratireductor sp.]